MYYNLNMLNDILFKKKKIKVGLALGSGGAKGLAHIGVIKGLEKAGIEISYIAGTSIGAIIGAHYAAYKDIKKLEDVIMNSKWAMASALFDLGLGGGVIKGKKIENLLKEWFKDIYFKDLLIPLTLVTTDLDSGKEVDINKGNLIKAIRASFSIPLIFEPVKFEGMILADGGLTNPLPDDVVKKMGADFVIAVNLETNYFVEKLKKKDLSFPGLTTRSLNIMRHQLALSSIKNVDLIIEPKVNEPGLVGWEKLFDKKQAMKTIRIGELAVEKALKNLKV